MIQPAGKHLFLMPAIDMVNHSTRPELRNATLNMPSSAPLPCFTMTAGGASLGTIMADLNVNLDRSK